MGLDGKDFLFRKTDVFVFGLCLYSQGLLVDL